MPLFTRVSMATSKLSRKSEDFAARGMQWTNNPFMLSLLYVVYDAKTGIGI